MKKNEISDIWMISKRIYITIIVILVLICGYKNWILSITGSFIVVGIIYLELKSNHDRKKEIFKYMNCIKIDGILDQDILINLPFPIVVVELDGKIIWKNEGFQEILDSFYIVSSKIQNLVEELNPQEFFKNVTISSRNIDIKGKKYIVRREFKKVSKKMSEDGWILVYYFIEQTQLLNLSQKYEDEKAVVGILYIDCYEDLVLSIDDENRSEMLLELEKAIQNWISPVNGIAKKFERDKYILFFENKWLDQFSKNDFEILNTVKEIKMGNTIPLTISIGIGLNTDSYAENFNNAKSALDIALGRGGDQVVIKDNEETSFFGGETIQAEKTTKVKARVVAYALRDIIEDSEQILIMGHQNCDMDALGAALGVWRICKNFNKEAHIVLNNSNININNMILKLSDKDTFNGTFINSVEALEKIDQETVVVIVDTNKPSLTECSDLLKYTKKIVVIDHHRRGTEYIKETVLTYLETYASSTCEMITEIIQYLDLDDKLDELEAQALFAGILVDTKNFLIKTGVRTFEAAALLRKYDVDTSTVKALLQNDLKTFVEMSNIIKVVEVVNESVAISKCLITTKEAQLISAKAADQLLNVTEIEASFVLSSSENDIVISGRSLGKVNVQIILEKLGGGGSFSNAGARLKDVDIDEAINQLKGAIAEYFERKNKN